MIHLLNRWSLGNRAAVIVASLALMLLGAYATLRMPVDVFPDLTAPTVTVMVEGEGMSPQEMESQVTFPIETAMNGAASVRRVRSGTAVGLSVVWVEFEWGTDIHRARQTVTERLGAVGGELPSQVKTPTIAPVSSIMGEIVFISLTSDRHGPIELHTAAQTQIRRRLLLVSGVSQVTPIGGDEKQYQVVLSPARLRAFDIAASEVALALEATNENLAAGVLIQGPQETIVEGIGRIRTERDIASTVVALRNGVPIAISDLGTVGIGAAIQRGAAASSRRGPNWEPIIVPGVILAIQKQSGANTLELTGRLDAALTEIQAGLPEGMFINSKLFRQSVFIENSISNTSTALLEGAAMVGLIVIAFLFSARASVITLLALPLSLVTAVLVLQLLGSNINTMTLGGMAIAIGALVDDAVIAVENIVRRLRLNAALVPEKRRTTMGVVYAASVEVNASMVLATVIILLVFTPIFFLSGIEGRLLRPLGIAFCVSLAASLVVALTLTPALCSLMLPRSRSVLSAREPGLVVLLKRTYARPLDWSLRHPWALAVPSVLLLGASVLSALSMGRNFLPEFNEGALVVGVVTVPGTSLAESDRLAGLVETALMDHPEVVAIGRRTGRAEGDEHVQGVEASEIDLTLDMEAAARVGRPTRTKSALLEALREDLATIPGVQTTLGQPISHRIDHMLSGTRASIAVKLFGERLETLSSVAGNIEAQMRLIPGVVDLSTEQQAQVPSLRVEYDREAMARHGLRVADVARALELATRGIVVGRVFEGLNTFELIVRAGAVSEVSATSIEDAYVDTPGGAKIPLKYLAAIREDRSPNFISRENVQRKIAVTCNVAGRDIRGVVEDIRAAILAKVELPPGYHVEYGGQFESAEATGRLLAVLGVLIVAGIAALLYFLFNSARDMLLVMVNLPLALIGGVLGVYLGGSVLSVASIIGFITVFGVAARNGIMLVSHIRHLQEFEGVGNLRDAVRTGAMERFAPILMTALAAGLALVPLALRGDQPGNEILTPMAIVILFGLLSSTALNMLLVPALYLRFGRPVALRSSQENDMELRHG